MTDRDIEVHVTRGQPTTAQAIAIDRLALTLDGDWVLVISGDHLHATVRPAGEATR